MQTGDANGRSVGYARMVSNLVTSDIPVRHEGEIGVVDGSVVSHLGHTAVGVLAMGKELVDGVESIRLDGIVGGEDDELGDVRLCIQSRSQYRFSTYQRSTGLKSNSSSGDTNPPIP